jgi:hypothetical protein
MNKSTLCLWLAVLVIAGCVLYPPWTDSYEGTHHKIWYAAINRPPSDALSPVLDYQRLITEIVAGESIVLILYLILGKKGR